MIFAQLQTEAWRYYVEFSEVTDYVEMLQFKLRSSLIKVDRGSDPDGLTIKSAC
jgi:hypothetical protein